MSLNPSFSTGLINALLNGNDITELFNGGQLDIYSGSQPTNADTTEGAGTLLATVDLPDGSTNQISNGTFDSGTGWTTGTGWSIAAGVASCDGSQVADSDLTVTPGVALVSGYEYEVTYTVSNYSAGNVVAVVGDTEGTDRSANGTYVEIIAAGSGADVDIRGDSNFVGDIDNVVVVIHALQETAASAVIAKNGLWQEAAAIVTGTAAWFRLRENGDGGGASTTAIRIDGTVGLDSGTFDLEFATTSFYANDEITVSTFTIGIALT